MKIKLTHEVEVKPFGVPNYLVRADHGNRTPLSCATAEQLSTMCDEWRAAVFAKAGHRDPALSEAE